MGCAKETHLAPTLSFHGALVLHVLHQSQEDPVDRELSAGGSPPGEPGVPWTDVPEEQVPEGVGE